MEGVYLSYCQVTLQEDRTFQNNLLFSTKNLKRSRTYKCNWLVLSLKQFRLASGSSRHNLYILFMCHTLYVPLCTLILYFLYFFFFLIDRIWKLLIKWFILVFFLKKLTIGQSIAQAATGENERQYNLSNIMQIKFWNFYSFSVRSSLKQAS